MKLATYKDGTRDGQLIVVSRDLSSAHYATGIASRLQQALDDWGFIAPQLQDLYDALNQGKLRHSFPFNPALCMAPLPRAYQHVRGQAYAEGALSLVQAASAPLLGAHEPMRCVDDATGVDFSAELSVITGDVPRGASADQALEAIRLVLLGNDVTLSALDTPRSTALHDKPTLAFAPVAVTLHELGEAWHNKRVNLTLQVAVNGRKVGLCDTGAEMKHHFGKLLSQACKTRALGAGTLVSTGTVAHAGKGYSSVAHKRAQELALDGQASTDYLRLGDALRIEAKGKDGHSVFGAIEQTLQSMSGAAGATAATAPVSASTAASATTPLTDESLEEGPERGAA